MANTQKNKVKLEDMNTEQRKAYNLKMSEYRKTNDFFKETGSKRVDKVIKGLRTVSFMGKYNGTDEQKENIVNAIDAAVDDMKSALYKESKKKETFNL